MGKAKDLTGERFGRLLIIGKSSHKDGKNTHWDYVCDCGIAGHSYTSRLTSGQKSCGCHTKEAIGPRSITHGQTVGWKWTATYRCYRAMIARCIYPSQVFYERYGGRGIRVCDRWMHGEDGMSGYECFVADMGEKPRGLTIDRKDNDGHYEPGNCRWATQAEQMLNTSATKFTHEDRSNVIDLCRSGMSRSAISRAVGMSRTYVCQIIDKAA
ncbi:hypothetical protein ABIA16_003803 [Sinorhizobium fredii]